MAEITRNSKVVATVYDGFVTDIKDGIATVHSAAYYGHAQIPVENLRLRSEAEDQKDRVDKILRQQANRPLDAYKAAVLTCMWIEGHLTDDEFYETFKDDIETA